jgi:hypothetical protein
MTDRSKFEEMLERLVNEDREGAEALFHEIVVERSREIYQSILESEDEDDLEEASDDEDEDQVDESEDEDDLEEASDDEDEELDEMFGLDEFEMEADPMGGDETDDMMGDMGMDDEGDDMGGDLDMDMDSEGGDTESRIQDLEDALEDLKAEFEAMMGGDEGDDMDMDDEGDDMDMDMDDEGDDESDDDEESKEAFAYESKKPMKKDDKKAKKTAGEEMREYVEKVNGGFGAKIGGDNGTNAKSIVAGKNDMGGTTANILRADTEQGVEAAKGHLKGSSLFKGTAKENNAGNINVPGAKAGKTAFKKSEPGHGAEKKGKPETADKSAGSLIKTTVRNK